MLSVAIVILLSRMWKRPTTGIIYAVFVCACTTTPYEYVRTPQFGFEAEGFDGSVNDLLIKAIQRASQLLEAVDLSK
jgi:hypothetical protein